MLLAKVLDKLFNRRNTFEIESLEGDIPASIKEQIITLITPLLGTSFKMGTYIYNDETYKFEWLEDEIPEDYTGVVYYFGDDLFEIYSYDNGSLLDTVSISAGYGINKVNLMSLTHSFYELDSTLKELCESSIADEESKPCTQAQWNVIKSLLDISLYFNFSGVSMIKTLSNGINSYTFGFMDADNTGAILEFAYNSTANLITVSFLEV